MGYESTEPRREPGFIEAQNARHYRQADRVPSEAEVEATVARWVPRVEPGDISEELAADADVQIALTLAFQQGAASVGRVMVAIRATLARRYALVEIYGAGMVELPEVGAAALAAVRAAEGGSQSDARLIAAAPDLLEALQDAEKALNNIRCCCHHTAWEATGPAVIAARAAIAKATGGAA